MEENRRSSSSSSALSLLSISGLTRRISYSKLPHEPIKLSVLKLDGSSFDIEVTQTATIAELKAAVEAAFSHLPNQGPDKISWPHVWEQFCLCYDEQKLVAEIDSIRNFGIKDGDQLYFIRHRSTNYKVIKGRTRKRDFASKPKKTSSSRLSGYGAREHYDEEEEECDEIERSKHQYYGINNSNLTRHHESRLTGFLRGWFLGSRRTIVAKTRSIVPKTQCEGKVGRTRYHFRFWPRFAKLVQFRHCKGHQMWRDTWQERC